MIGAKGPSGPVPGKLICAFKEGTSEEEARSVIVGAGLGLDNYMAILRLASVDCPAGEENKNCEKLRGFPCVKSVRQQQYMKVMGE